MYNTEDTYRDLCSYNSPADENVYGNDRWHKFSDVTFLRFLIVQEYMLTDELVLLDDEAGPA